MGQFLPLDDLQTYKNTLKLIPHLKDFQGQYLDELFRASELCDFEAGETIVEEGEFGHRIFFLLLGKVALTHKEPQRSRPSPPAIALPCTPSVWKC